MKLVCFHPCIRQEGFFDKAPRLIDAYDGKVWRNRYEIKVSPKLNI